MATICLSMECGDWAPAVAPKAKRYRHQGQTNGHGRHHQQFLQEQGLTIVTAVADVHHPSQHSPIVIAAINNGMSSQAVVAQKP